MIRRVCIVLLVTATAATSASAGPRLGVEGGLRLTELTREWDPLVDHQPSTEFETGWTLGTVVEQRLAGGLALVSGLRYVQDGEDDEIRFMSTSGPGLEELLAEYQYRFQSLEVPLRLEWRPWSQGAFGGAVLEGGLGAAYLLEASYTVDVSSPSSGTTSSRDTNTGLYERWSLSAGLGAGWDLGLGAGVGTIRFRYAHGLTDWVGSEALDRYANAFELLLGWRR